MCEDIDAAVCLLKTCAISLKLGLQLAINVVVCQLLVVLIIQSAIRSGNCLSYIIEVEEQSILVNQNLTSLNLSLVVSIDQLILATESVNFSLIKCTCCIIVVSPLLSLLESIVDVRELIVDSSLGVSNLGVLVHSVQLAVNLSDCILLCEKSFTCSVEHIVLAVVILGLDGSNCIVESLNLGIVILNQIKVCLCNLVVLFLNLIYDIVEGINLTIDSHILQDINLLWEAFPVLRVNETIEYVLVGNASTGHLPILYLFSLRLDYVRQSLNLTIYSTCLVSNDESIDSVNNIVEV